MKINLPYNGVNVNSVKNKNQSLINYCFVNKLFIIGNEVLNEDLFKKARDYIGPGLIIALFQTQGARKTGDEYFCLSPLRDDTSVGSFVINLNNGVWKDFATGDGGDFIELVSKAFSLSLLDAAKKIISESGGVIPTEIKETKSKKPQAILPVPVDEISGLKKRLESDFSIKRFGDVEKNSGWSHFDEDGGLCFVVVRHVTGGNDGKKRSKSDIPYYYTIENKWKQGYPPQLLSEKKLPLFNVNKLNGFSGTIVIVEGQKCASVMVSRDYLLITWSGGSNGVDNNDWLPLQNVKNNILQWPDADLKKNNEGDLYPDNVQPGLKACLNIQNKYLPKSKILKIDNIKNIDGWDIFDAFTEGFNLVEYIEKCPTYRKGEISEYKEATSENTSSPAREVTNLQWHPFKILGYNGKFHYFLPDSAPIPIGIPRLSITKNAMNELAPFSFWINHFGNDSGQRIKEDLARDWLVGSSHKKGYYNPDIIRGSGVWRDKGRIIVNNGDKIITHDGQTFSYQDFESDHIYILSEAKMGNFKGDISTPDDGRDLINLFKAQNFSHPLGHYGTIGWCLMAPFCSFLSWRPAIWIVGPGRSGKSYLIDNIMTPLVGPFCYNGSGRDSESAIRRSIGQNGQPAIIDETEPRTPEARKRLDSQIDLVRNGTSDASSKISLSNGTGGVDSFRIRSCFAFSSIVPYLDGNAIESRFIICRLNGLKKEGFQEKKDKTIELINKGVLKNPEKYRRRIFKLLPIIDKNIEFLRNHIFMKTGDQRLGDNCAPFFSGIYALENEDLLTDSSLCLNEFMSVLEDSKEQTDADEDMLIREILAAHIREDMETYTVSQLLYKCYKNENVKKNFNILEKYGIKVSPRKNEIAIVKNNRQIRQFLMSTPYAAKYGEILSRHPAVANPGKSVRIADTSGWSVTFHMDKFIDTFCDFGVDEGDEDEDKPEGQNLSTDLSNINMGDQDESPF